MAVFELGGALAPAIPDLVVGPWRAPPGLVAFDTGAAGGGPPESLWRVSLARNAAAAQAELADGERGVALTHAALDDVPRRLERALDRAVAIRERTAIRAGDRRIADEIPAFDSRRVAARPHPRRDAADELSADSRLVAALVGIPARRPVPLLAWDTDVAETVEPEPDEPGRIERALEQIGDLARGRARIETRIEGAVIAHSLMTLSGDTELCAIPGLSASGAKLHARSVAVALRTRHAWARILALVVRGCGRILALGLPAGGLAALPLVWGFVRDLLRELRNARAAPRTA
jgi:hypothetical protein